MVVLEDEETGAKGQQTLQKLWEYNFKLATFNFAAAWKAVRISTVANDWKNCSLLLSLNLILRAWGQWL
jgi:hypothetical protein